MADGGMVRGGRREEGSNVGKMLYTYSASSASASYFVKYNPSAALKKSRFTFRSREAVTSDF